MNTQTARNILRSSAKSLRWESFKKRYLELKLKSFYPKVSFSFDFHGYTIKTVSNSKELWEVLKLRYNIFTETYGVKMKFSEIDFDKLDLLGDHVILIDQATQKIIGTYRLMCSSFTNEFYSDSEFEINEFKRSPGVKVELGRACIHPDYRTGASISLIWRGLAKYVLLTEASYLFGCTSVRTTDSELAASVLNFCQKEYQGNKFNIHPTKKYVYPHFSKLQIVKEENFDIEQYIPSLMKSYLAAGAFIYGEPALDKSFGCTDYFTVLDLENINPMYYKRYFKPWRE
ncbi:MAG: GNAT family N-acetyltransferase [Bdellovibrionales bacterium]|nr:GNAT family N-acetyltransferase [Bdellovibrionales bacterium]